MSPRRLLPVALAVALGGALLGAPPLAGTAGAVPVATGGEFVTALEDPGITVITLTADVVLADEPVRPLGAPALEIDGQGFSITAEPTSRALSAFNPVGALSIHDVTVVGGSPGGGVGAGIAWGGPVHADGVVVLGGDASTLGGGIYANGDSTITDSTFEGTSAGSDGGAVWVASGGLQIVGTTIVDAAGPGTAVVAAGPVTIDDSVIRGSENVAVGIEPGTSGETVWLTRSTLAENGIGIAAASNTVRLDESTITGSTDRGIIANGEIHLTNSTLHANGVSGAAAGDSMWLRYSTVTGHDVNVEAENVITTYASALGESTVADCGSGGVVTEGANVADDDTCFLDDPSDLQGVDLQLGPIGDHGGTTPSRVPSSSSPLLDTHAPCDLATDQRGVARPQASACDTGAVERAATDTPPPPAETGLCDPAPEDGFVDVPPADVHEANIDCLALLGITTGGPGGLPADQYGPTLSVSRGQLASFLVRVLAATPHPLPDAGPSPFTDDDGTTHEDAIDRLTAAGLVSGLDASHFGPAEPVSRGQMATLLAGVAEHALGQGLPVGPDAFDDDDGHVHEAAINALAAAGLVSGRSPGMYEPGAPVARAPMATFLVNLVRHLHGEAAYTPA